MDHAAALHELADLIGEPAAATCRDWRGAWSHACATLPAASLDRIRVALDWTRR